MSAIIFNPLNSFCADWRKIHPEYKKHLDYVNPIKCSLCGAPATNRCSACQKVAYCSTNHQKSHWKSKHRSQCCPFKIVKNPQKPELGRFVVATRDIAPGEIIMEEPPVTAGKHTWSFAP